MRSSFDTRRWPDAEGVDARALTVAAAIVGSAVVGGVLSSSAQSDAANTAANAQTQASQAGIAEQQRQFNNVQALLNPFVQAATGGGGGGYAPRSTAPAGAGGFGSGGGGSLGAQMDIIGLNGGGPQQAAIDRLKTMPAFTSALQLGENRILQNASATGGLRGGNTQGALGYFAPSLLAQQINDYYGRLAGITSLGENAAAMVGNAGMQTGQGVANLLQQGGSAQAGAALANGRAQSNLYSSMSGALGQYIGMGGSFGSGVTPDAIQGAFAQTGAGSSGFGTGMAYGNQDYGLFI